MTQTVFLHVGLPKSGTTYVQSVLSANKQALMDAEKLLFPGDGWAAQIRATRDVREMPGPDATGAWPTLVEEIHAWPGDVVVSMEWLCAAGAEHVRRIVDDLSPSRVVVIFTVRDLARALPSGWQEMMKNRRIWSWRTFLDVVTSDEPHEEQVGRRFWKKFDVPRMIDTWTTAVPREDVVVVTVPPASAPHDLLWQRLCTVLDIDPQDLGRSTRPRNESLGLESTEVMRRVNELFRERSFTRDDVIYYKRLLTREVMPAHRASESRLRVPATHRAWVLEAASGQIDGIAERGVRVVGDLEELRPTLSGDGVEDLADLPPDALLDASLHALMGVLEEHRHLRRESGALERRADRLERRVARQQERLTRLRSDVDRLRSRPLRTGARWWARRTRARLSGR
jgi:NADH:ubiquinone oxidoreductase subunit